MSSMRWIRQRILLSTIMFFFIFSLGGLITSTNVAEASVTYGSSQFGALNTSGTSISDGKFTFTGLSNGITTVTADQYGIYNGLIDPVSGYTGTGLTGTLNIAPAVAGNAFWIESLKVSVWVGYSGTFSISLNNSSTPIVSNVTVNDSNKDSYDTNWNYKTISIPAQEVSSIQISISANEEIGLVTSLAGFTVGEDPYPITPSLSNVGSSAITKTTATISATSNKNSTLYYVVTQSSTAPTAAQIIAGQNNAGTAAISSGNSTVTANAAKSFNLTGLTAGTQYYYYFVARDSRNNNLSSIGNDNFTTMMDPAAAPTATPSSGTVVANNSTVTLSSATSGATIYYTKDGSIPTTSSTSGASVTITGTPGATVTVKALAAKAGYLNSTVTTFTYTILNNAPTANPGSATLNEDNASTGTLSGSDPDTGTTLTYTKATSPTHGTVSVDSTTGSYTYTPDANYNGTDSFTFTVNDGSLTSAPATVYLTVSSVNDTPTATADSGTINEDTALNGTLSGTDPDAGTTLTYAKGSNPTHGTLTINPTTGAYTYTPDPNYNGPDSFTFTVSDGTLTSAAATISLTVTSVNDVPMATADSDTTDEDTVLNGTLSGTDIEAGTLTYAKASDPAHGTVIINATTGAYTYTPANNYNGPDSFTFTVNDGNAASAAATISITVTAVSDAPSAITDSVTTDEDNSLEGTLSGTDPDTGATLTYAKASDPAHGTVSINATTGAFTYTSAANYNGPDSFTFTVNDGTSTSAAATISITVTAVNDVPTATAGSGMTSEDTELNGTLSGTDLESGAGSLIYAKATDPAHGTVSINVTTGAYTYTPVANYNGSDSFTFTVNDGDATSTAATITITVTAVNDPPTATADNGTTNEDTVLNGTLNGTDPDAGATLTYAKATDPAHGTLSINTTTGAYTYTPAADYNGSDSFTFTVNDGTSTSAPATISITVSAGNDAPTATAGSGMTNEDSELNGTLNGTDPDAGSTLTYAKAADPAHGTVSINSATGAYTYTPAVNYNGPDSFTFTVNDGDATSAAATITITVTAVNDTPTATADNGTTNEDTVLNGTLNGTDPDAGAALTYAKATDPAHGTLSINTTTGAYTYTPAADYNGSDSFTFTVNDGTSTSAPATISITVSAGNDAPTATAGSGTTNEDSDLNGTLNGTDPDAGSTLTYAKATDPAHGTVSINSATGAYTYTPAANYNGPDSFTFTVNDGDATSSAATITITVTAVNDAPTATADNGTTNEDTALDGTLNGTDPDAGAALTYAKATDPSHGTLTINPATGAYTYTPAANYNGPDSFTFTVSDGTEISAAATISLTVTAVNDAPTATADSGVTNEDTELNGTLSGADIDTGTTLTYAKATDPLHGTLTIDATTGAYTYTPEANYNGADSFTFTVNDGDLTSSPATISLSVTAVNDVPTATPVSVTTNEGKPLKGTLSGSDIDEGTALTYAKVTDPAHGTLTIDAATGAYTYRPSSNYNGPDSFTFTVNDGTSTSAEATVNITVKAVNHNSGGQTNVVNVEVLINGKLEKVGTATTTTVNGQTVTKITVDQALLEQKLAAEGKGAVVTIFVKSESDILIGELNGLMIKMMIDKQAILKVQTEQATYTLSSKLINLDDLLKRYGGKLEDIIVQIKIAKSNADMKKIAENAALKGKFTLLTSPLEFSVTVTIGDKTIEITKFSSYVKRSIVLPDGIDKKKLMTGIVIDPDGKVRHVPTKFELIDGKYHAVIGSLTNSMYAIVSYPAAFNDVQNHWAKEAVNNMGSRMVIQGTGEGDFEPDRAITRAEFAAIIVRGLGLKLEDGNTIFSDINSSDWYNSAILTAYSYHLINGYSDGTFRPNDKITREEAMEIISKAMVITGLKDTLSNLSIDDILKPFADAGNASNWAQDGIADCIQAGVVSGRSSTMLAPKANITRAEVAAIIERLLQKSDLI